VEKEVSNISRRSAIGAVGATVAAAAWSAGGVAWADTGTPGGDPGPQEAGAPVRLLLNGAGATPGRYAFPGVVDTIVLDNGLARFTFGRDDLNGAYAGTAGVSIAAVSVVVNGVELGHNLNGSNPVDDGKAPSFYVDDSGGKTRLICTEIEVLRVGPDLVEVAFIDNTSTPLQHEHHLIMRRGRRGIYGYDILTAAAATSINEVRMNTRWDRSIFDHTFNWERGTGQQPTYQYLNTQLKLQDETWRIDGVNNPGLPSPESNSGNLPAGTAYSKYDWSLYHHENPMWGHFGHGFGVWFTPLGGVTDTTLSAFYGVGPTHQDLAVHQDAIILNYFGANHYGLPAYPLAQGYRRLYGPWYTYFTVGDEDDPDGLIADAAAVARREIAENRTGADWMDDELYPAPAERSTVTGRVEVTDGRPAGGLWVLLSVQDVDDVYTIHEPTYFVRTDAQGRFRLPGIPPATLPGTTTPGSYTLYVFAAGGSIVDQYKQTGVVVSGPATDLGVISWTPASHSTFLWQIGSSTRRSDEFALATHPIERVHPRGYDKPSTIPGDLDFTIGESWEPTDWYYAQTNAGTWTITFGLDRPYQGTAYLTVSTAMQSGKAPRVAVNGSTAVVVNSLPGNNDSTIARQADRSGYFRQAVLSFPADALQVGVNTITLTRGTSGPAGDGLGWDTFVLEVAEPTAPPAAKLRAEVVGVSGTAEAVTWTVRVTNKGRGAANDVRLTGVQRLGRWGAGEPVPVSGRDPRRFPVPVAAALAPGASTTIAVTTGPTGPAGSDPRPFTFRFGANGGRATATATAPANGADRP
jgi:rhamnogalacturonan endolyase